MKKKLFNGFILAAVCIGALGIQKNLMSSNSSLSGLMLENVEALTYNLPEVVITCNQKGTYGKCWREGVDMKFCGEYTYYECKFTGYQQDYCTHPC